MKFHELKQLQNRPLEQKIEEAQCWIKAALAEGRKPAVAFSGGKDSLVLLHFVLEQCPDVDVIYGDTGVEFPECRKYTHDLAQNWGFKLHVARPARTKKDGYKYSAQKKIWNALVESGEIASVLKPDGKLKTTQALEKACPPSLKAELSGEIWKKGTRKSFFWCVDQYGWPILGKDWSKLDARRINIDTFLALSKSKSIKPKLLEYYRVLKSAKISQHCCSELKKKPSERVQKKLGVDLIFKGLLASESRNRAISFLKRGWLFRGRKLKYLNSGRLIHCSPLATWTDEDIWNFIYKENLPYASLYDLTYTSEKDGSLQSVKRNGCMYCATDFQYRDNHLFVLRQTHPGRWQSAMQRGLGAEIINLQNAYRKNRKRQENQLSLWGEFSVNELVEKAPCVFDTL